MRPPRFSVLRLMAVVAVSAAALVLYVRHERFTGLAKLHRDEVTKLSDLCRISRKPYEHHVALVAKYERAARLPFLPVAADPPMPE
jgi:hypothetical protein